MKVAIFTETYLPYINGVVTHISILKEGLEKMGHEVLIVTADPDTHRHYVKDDVLHCPAHESKRLYGYGLALPLSQRRLKLVKQFRPDIIHIHQEFGVGFSGILIAKILHVPIVYTMHTMYDEYLYYIAPQKLLPLVRRIAHSYSRMIARSASAITGPSAKIQEYFTEVGVEKHVNVIPNPVELDMFNPDNITAEQRAEIRRKHNIPDHKMIACFVGRLGKEKSVDLLFDYWAEEIKPEDDIHLIIIGDGPSRPELEQQAKDLGIDKMITFTGAIMHNEMPPYYAVSDIYITASLSDTCSISMLEGMASGLPVLQRYDKLNEDQVRNGINGYTFDSAKEMADVLRMLKAKTPEEFVELKQSVINSVKKSGAESLANSLLEIYKNYEHHIKRVDK